MNVNVARIYVTHETQKPESSLIVRRDKQLREHKK